MASIAVGIMNTRTVASNIRVPTYAFGTSQMPRSALRVKYY